MSLGVVESLARAYASLLYCEHQHTKYCQSRHGQSLSLFITHGQSATCAGLSGLCQDPRRGAGLDNPDGEYRPAFPACCPACGPCQVSGSISHPSFPENQTSCPLVQSGSSQAAFLEARKSLGVEGVMGWRGRGNGSYSPGRAGQDCMKKCCSIDLSPMGAMLYS